MFKILQKELRTLFKDRRALILGLLMPIILISIFSLAFGGMNKGNNKKTQLLVCDEDKTEFTKKLVVAIDSIKTIDMATTTLDTALDLVKNLYSIKDLPILHMPQNHCPGR